MTLRKNTAASLGPEEIAGMVPAIALEMFPPDDYRAYFTALAEEVETITGQHDHSLTLRVAQVLGIDPASWLCDILERRNGPAPGRTAGIS